MPKAFAFFSLVVAVLATGCATNVTEALTCNEAAETLRSCDAEPDPDLCSDESPAAQRLASDDCAGPGKADLFGERELGDECSWDWQCWAELDLICVRVCAAPLSIGETCEEDDDCESNNCYNLTCHGNAIGDFCSDDDQCTTNNCWGYSCRGTGPGERCEDDDDCDSGVCFGEMCR
ncbi:MAG: hypothetical protein JRH11_06100 [Deltaproteobacteria bacterium]|nr:hypothetical protein [Deltaproteobacteria bacterium]